MRTEKVNFTGIYKIPNAPENIKLINEKVIPMYKYMRNRNVVGLPSENPVAFSLEFIKEIIGKSQGASKEWLVMNAQRHGIELPRLNNDNLFIVSGDDDIQKFIDFFTERLKANSKNPFQRFLEIFKPKVDHSADLPEHLKPLPEVLERYNKEVSAYNDFISKENIISVSTPQELLTKMMMEK